MFDMLLSFTFVLHSTKVLLE